MRREPGFLALRANLWKNEEMTALYETYIFEQGNRSSKQESLMAAIIVLDIQAYLVPWPPDARALPARFQCFKNRTG